MKFSLRKILNVIQPVLIIPCSVAYVTQPTTTRATVASAPQWNTLSQSTTCTTQTLYPSALKHYSPRHYTAAWCVNTPPATLLHYTTLHATTALPTQQSLHYPIAFYLSRNTMRPASISNHPPCRYFTRLVCVTTAPTMQSNLSHVAASPPTASPTLHPLLSCHYATRPAKLRHPTHHH